MKEPFFQSLNIRGYLMDLDIPKVMGILNITPDSFYSASRTPSEEQIRIRIKKMIDEGVDIIDIGGCSTRPGFTEPSPEEELERVLTGCRLIKELAPSIPLSLDTYRASVARQAIKEYGVDIINDVSGGRDSLMWEIAAENKVGYVLTHNPEIQQYHDVTAETITWMSKRVNELHRSGVNDVILDPGYGFAKTLEENFRLLDELDEIVKIGLPVLVGLSRKSMIYKTLGCTPEESLTGTIALDTVALLKGAHILRVHDVKQARETVTLFTQIKKSAS